MTFTRTKWLLSRGVMMVINQKNLHWDYYLSLENDLINCRRFVEFHDANMNTYSIEFLKLLFLACSEVDIVSQRICQILEPNSKSKKMKGYITVIESTLHLSEFQVMSFHSGSPIQPFKAWESNDYPQWWGDYNAVKHNRFYCYPNATLQNTIQSLAGLYVLNIYYYYNHLREAELTPQSNLFRPNQSVVVAATQMTYGYRLPHGDRLYPESPHEPA